MFYKFLLEHGPRIAFSNQLFLEFLFKYSFDASYFFLKNLQQENEIQKSISTETNDKYEEDLKEIKDELLKEKTNFLNKL